MLTGHNLPSEFYHKKSEINHEDPTEYKIMAAQKPKYLKNVNKMLSDRSSQCSGVSEDLVRVEILDDNFRTENVPILFSDEKSVEEQKYLLSTIENLEIPVKTLGKGKKFQRFSLIQL